jgi:hypothetical protein
VRSNRLTWALVAVVLVLVGAGGGYLLAGAVDDDGSPTVTGDTTSTTGSAGSPGGSAPAAEGTSVVLSSIGVVGWWTDGGWVPAGDGTPPIRGGEQFTFVTLGGPRGTATGGELGTTCEITEPYGADVELDPPFPDPDDGTTQLAVTGVTDPLPRAAEPLDTKSATYAEAASAALSGVGIHDAHPPIAQLLRADLDGDGSDEVLITATRIRGKALTKARDGDYSAVILRRLVDGQVRSQVLAHSIASSEGGDASFAFVHEYRIAAVADLNGDGRLEVAVASHYYEGAAIDVYAERDAGQLASVLATGCGA